MNLIELNSVTAKPNGINYLEFNGETSESFGVYVGGQGTFNAPQRDVTKYSIPGRNGDLIKDNGRFLNIAVTYPVVVIGDFDEKTALINSWLKSPTSYCRLEDTHHPDYYRMAMCIEGIKYETGTLNRYGKGEITFNCKPQKWLKSGESRVRFTAAGAIMNPTRFPSKPLIRISGSGSGTVTINGQTISVFQISDYVDIDSEMMTCYKATENKNNTVVLNGSFPELKPGKNVVSFSGGVTEVSIFGRWWTI